jgi:hypothetical protein
LSIAGRKPSFHVRATNELSTVTADVRLPDGWCHLAGVLGADKSLKLYVNGKLQATAMGKAFIATNPAQPLEIGGDNGGAVGDYKAPSPFVGAVDELRIFHRELTTAELAEAHDDPEKSRRLSAEALVALTFDAGAAKDESGHKNDGNLNGQPTGQGRIGTCVLFPKLAAAAGGNVKPGGLHFEHQWTQFTPVFCRSMVLSQSSLLYAGPPDILDEEYAFERQAAKDSAIQDLLQRQDDALEGKLGFQLRAVSLKDGGMVSEVKFDSTPVWDGMTTAYGRIFVATIDGHVLCLGQ